MSFSTRLLAATLLLAFLAGCLKEDPPVPYEISAVYAENLDNTGQAPVAAQDSVYKLAYVLRITYAAALDPEYKGEYDSYESPLYNNDPFTSFSVTCSTDFDASHPAGTPLNDLFSPGMDLSEEVNYEKMRYKMYYPSRPIDLWLMSPPDVEGSYQFTVEFVCESGKILTATATPIVLHS